MPIHRAHEVQAELASILSEALDRLREAREQPRNISTEETFAYSRNQRVSTQVINGQIVGVGIDAAWAARAPRQALNDALEQAIDAGHELAASTPPTSLLSAGIANRLAAIGAELNDYRSEPS